MEDYEKNGIMYCGKCNMPKFYYRNVFGKEYKARILCSCERNQLETENQERLVLQEKINIRTNRSRCFKNKEMYSCTFDNSEKSKIILQVQNYFLNFEQFHKKGKGLLLYGKVGVGKSYAVACLANALIDHNHTVLMTSFSNLINELWNVEDKSAYIRSLNIYDLLIIDDLGTERQNSEYVREQIFNLVNTRYTANLPMIFTTNLTPNEIKKPSNVSLERIYDRILERCHPLEVVGENRRRNKLRQEFSDMNCIINAGINKEI